MKHLISLLALSLLLICQPAVALDLQAAKAQGLVGETATGYLAPVKPGPEVQKLVDSINARRKAHYQKISTRNKTSLGTVEKLAGKKAIEKTPAGQFIFVGGHWTQK